MSVTYATCVDDSDFSNLLTTGKKYSIIAIYDEKQQVYLQADNGKKRWFPFSCFSLPEGEYPTFEVIQIESITSGPIDQSIEVKIRFSTGELRWCWFATPQMLARHSELLDGTEVWVHYDNENLILLGTLTTESAQQAIDHIHKHGNLLDCTLPCEG